jgi:hypothetical protein
MWAALILMVRSSAGAAIGYDFVNSGVGDIGVGPAVVWSGLSIGQSNGNSTNIALVVEPGIRWILLKNVSVDTSFRYRMASPSYDFSGVDVKLEPLHQLSFLVRANYHF